MRSEESIHDDGGKSVYIYDEANLLVMVQDLLENGAVSMQIVYRYDEAGNNIERIITRGAGILLRRLSFRFDSNGRAHGYDEFDANDELVYRFEYTYGSTGEKILVRIYDGSGILLRETLEDII